jgi:hypothetical protein
MLMDSLPNEYQCVMPEQTAEDTSLANIKIWRTTPV